jgi:6-phosphogluconolactonase (cycloisomerase 2 family)
MSRGALAAAVLLLAALGGCQPGEEYPMGSLVYLDRFSDASIDGAYAVAVSPDGKHVYVTATTSKSVAWFARDSVTGALTYGGSHTDTTYLSFANSIAISPDGRHVYVTASNTDTLMWFVRDESTGELSYLGRYTGSNIDDAVSVVVSPDGKHAYVAAWLADAVAWFTRDTDPGSPDFGNLTYVDRYQNSSTIDTPRCVAISPDGNHVYVGASTAGIPGGSDGTVAWFDRDAATGALSYIDKDTRTEIDGIYSIAVSSAGTDLYVAASDTATVAWYRRDVGTGAATYGDRHSDFSALSTAQSVALSPDDLTAYVAAGNSDAVAWLGRDSTTGGLAYAGRYSDPGLDFARSVAVSPDGNNVYVTAWTGDAVAWFRRD